MSDYNGGYIDGYSAVMQDGGVFIPSLLLRSYRRLGITETELLLLLQLMVYRQADAIDFPTPEQLSRRLGTTVQEIETMLQRLMKEKYVTIDEIIDPGTGMQSERYNWSGWLRKAAELRASYNESNAAAAVGEAVQAMKAHTTPIAGGGAVSTPNLFSLFEQEFGRPLSPMELETISGWLDQDHYSDELIRFALKEAVFAGKLHFRYIDRILIEWSRNRVTNVDEARAHTQNFRGGGKK